MTTYRLVHYFPTEMRCFLYYISCSLNTGVLILKSLNPGDLFIYALVYFNDLFVHNYIMVPICFYFNHYKIYIENVLSQVHLIGLHF